MEELLTELWWKMSMLCWWTGKRKAWNIWKFRARPLEVAGYKIYTVQPIDIRTEYRFETESFVYIPGPQIDTELSANPQLSRQLFIRRHQEIAEHLQRIGSNVNPYKVLYHLTNFFHDRIQSTPDGKYYYYPTEEVLAQAKEAGRGQMLDEMCNPIKVSRFAKFDY